MAYRNRIVGHGEVDPTQLLANHKNWRIHPSTQEDALAGVLEEVGWVDSILVNQRTGFVIDGHLRAAHAISHNEALVPVDYVDVSEEEEDKILATFDPISAMATTDTAKLTDLLAGINADSQRMVTFLATMHPVVPLQPAVASVSLRDRFLVPPFSVLDARQGYWQERKRQWLAIGLQSELGRGETPGSSARAAPGEKPTYRQIGSGKNGLLGESEQARSHYRNAVPGGSTMPAASLGTDGRTVRGDSRGRKPKAIPGGAGEEAQRRRSLTYAPGASTKPIEELDEVTQKILAQQNGTSIFDPVLCELAYRWFCPPTGKVLDPFAGGSVRGIVASVLGRSYLGLELRPEQLDANAAQLHLAKDPAPAWVLGDARDIGALSTDGPFDLLFSCPPYADLERYSDDPRDLSTMPYTDFLDAYRHIVRESLALLAPNRFACFVVGDVRDPKGMYRGFVADTIAAFEDAGAHLYNEAILVTAVGSLSIRVGNQFTVSRKLGKTHQNVMVFVKGDPKKATSACGHVDVVMPDEMQSGQE